MDDDFAAKLKAMDSFALPDPEELERSLVEQAKRIVPLTIPFNIESWKPGLLALSVQTEVIEFSVEEISLLQDMIQQAHGDGRTADRNSPAYATLFRRIAKAIDAVGGRAFIRLGSRSPKDSWGYLDNDMKMVPIYNASDAIGLLTSESERLWNDVDDARRADYIPRLCIRRFLDFDLEHEFRCFVEDDGIVGITQYHIRDGAIRWIVKNAAAIETAIRDYLIHAVIPLSGLASFTADIIIRRDMVPFLLELNPPLSVGRTFPGLFDGSKEDADGTFRYLGKPDRAGEGAA